MVGEMPLLVDLVEMPGPGDRSVRCTNVRTLDGKRPSFVHERTSTFILPLATIKVIEAPAAEGEQPYLSEEHGRGRTVPPPVIDEEPDEDLLARIRSV